MAAAVSTGTSATTSYPNVNLNPIGIVPPKTPTNNVIGQALDGVEKLMGFINDIAQVTLNPSAAQATTTTNGSLEKATTVLGKCLEKYRQAFPLIEEKRSSLADLKTQIASYESHTAALALIEKKFNENHNIQAFLESLGKMNINDVVSIAKNELDDLAKKTELELSHLQYALDQYKEPLPDLSSLFFRIHPHIPEEVVLDRLEKSKVEETSTKQHYEELKSNLKEAILKFDKLRSLAFKLTQKTETVLSLSEHLETIHAHNKTIETAKRELNDVSPNIVIAGFQAEGKERFNVSNGKKLLESYKSKIEQQEPIKDCLAKLQLFKQKRNEIVEILINISDEIKQLESEDTGIIFDQSEFKEQLKKQQKTSLKSLVDQRANLEKEWNSFCEIFNKTNHNLAIIQQTQKFILLASQYCLTGIDIHDTMRFTRKNESIKEEHYKAHYTTVTSFDEIYKLVASENPSISKVYSESLISDEIIEDLEKSDSEGIFNATGFVWTSEDSKEIISSRIETQNLSFAEDLKKSNTEIKEAFENSLPTIWQFAADEINFVSKHLSSYKNSSFDSNFNRSYPPKSQLGSAVMSTAAAAATGVLSIFGVGKSASSVGATLPVASQSYMERQSPFLRTL